MKKCHSNENFELEISGICTCFWWFWLVVGGFGWFRLVGLAGFGWLWVVLGSFGWLCVL